MDNEVCLDLMSGDSRSDNPDDPEYVQDRCNQNVNNAIDNNLTKASELIEIDKYCKNKLGVSKSEDGIMQKNMKITKGFLCVICGHVASSNGRLKEHHNKHTGKKPLQCNICKKKFAWRCSYRSHMACHSNSNQNQCQICEKKYCSKASLKKHLLRVHQKDERLLKVCNTCKKVFHTDSELLRHSFVHTSERPCVCERCGKSYRYKTALAIHMKTHSGEKPYKCEFCDASFLYLSSAIGHRRIHTKEKPFQCSVCQKRCRTKRLLSSHMTIHSKTKQFKCNSCGKCYSSRSGYRSHLDYHLGLKRHVCKYCGKAFRARNNMDKHVRRHAKNQSCLREKNKSPKIHRPKNQNTSLSFTRERSQGQGSKNMPQTGNFLYDLAETHGLQMKDCSVVCQDESSRNLPLQVCSNGVPPFIHRDIPFKSDHYEFTNHLQCQQYSLDEAQNAKAVYWNMDYNVALLERPTYCSCFPASINQCLNVHPHLASSQCQMMSHCSY